MKKRALFALPILLVLAILIMLFINIRREPQAMISIEKLEYASNLWFRFRMVIDNYISREEHMFGDWSIARRYAHPESVRFNGFYTEIVLVHNRAQARDFPDNVIVAWPGGEGDLFEYFGQGLVAWINWSANLDEEAILARRLNRNVINLEDFGLPNPITVKDLVDNWEKVNALWQAFDGNERDDIRELSLSYPRHSPPSE